MKIGICSPFVLLKYVFLTLCCCVFLACKKDQDVQVKYDVNEAVIEGIDSVYAVNPGGTISIRPGVTFTMDSHPDSINYRYEWYYVRMVGFISDKEYTVVSTSRTLTYKMPGYFGAFDLLLRVTDLRTNLFTEKTFRVYTTNFIYEGWMLLCDDQGKTRLDMLSFKVTENDYDYIPNVLQAAGSQRMPDGVPKFIKFVIGGDSKTNLWDGGIIIGTDKSAYAYGTRVLQYVNDLLDANGIVKGAASDAMTFNGGYYLAYLSINGKIYKMLSFNGGLFLTQILQEDRTLRQIYASPFVAANSFTEHSPSVFFDEIKKELVWYVPPNSYANPFVRGSLFDTKTGKNLLYLDYTQHQGGQYLALLQDSITQDVFMARFALNEQIAYNKIVATDIDKADQFAIHPVNGTVYYRVENKLYKIDEKTYSSRLVKDFGENLISAMKFNTFLYLNPTIVGTTASEERYKDIQNSLLVCTYDPFRPDDSGKFTIYSIDDQNASLSEKYSFDGLPKIVDVVYKER